MTVSCSTLACMMDKLNDKQIDLIVKWTLTNKNSFSEDYLTFFKRIEKSPLDFTSQFSEKLSNPNYTTKLTAEQLITVANLFNQKNLKRAVFKRISPNDQKAHPELGEETTTTTANTAPYIKPMGQVLRAKPKKKSLPK